MASRWLGIITLTVSALLAACNTVSLWSVWESLKTLSGPGPLYCIMMLPMLPRARKATKPSSLHIRISMGCSMFARPCSNGVGMGQHAANGAGTGWGLGQGYILGGGNGVNHLSPCHSLVATLSSVIAHCLTSVMLMTLTFDLVTADGSVSVISLNKMLITMLTSCP